MKLLWSVIIFFLPQFYPGLFAQCPDKIFLQKRIEYLRDSASMSADEQIKELLEYELKTQVCRRQDAFINAVLLQRIGALYILKSDFPNAVIYTNRALAILYLPNLVKPDADYVIQAYFNLSVCYQSLHMWSMEMQMYDSCITAGLRLDAGRGIVLWALFKKTEYLFNKGDYQRSIDYAVTGKSLTVSDPASAGYYQKFLDWQINALVFLKQYKLAEKELDKIFYSSARTIDVFEQGLAYGLLGVVQRETKRYSQAIVSFSKAYSLSMSANAPTIAASHLNNIGFLYMDKLGDYKLARNFFLDAIKICDFTDSIRIFSNLGILHSKTGEFNKALEFYQKGIEMVAPGKTEETLLTTQWVSSSKESVIEYISGLLTDKIKTLFDKGRKQKNISSLKESLRLALLTDKLFDKLNAEHSELQSRLFWRESAMDIYENAIACSRLLDDKELLFYFFEKSRSVLLMNDLNEQSKMQEQDFIKHSYYKKMLQQMNAKLISIKENTEDYSALQNSIFLLKQEEDKAVLLLRQKKTLTKQDPFTVLDKKGLKKIHQFLYQQQATLIEYFVGDTAVYSLIITPDSISSMEINKSRLNSLTTKYAEYISNPVALNKYFKEFKTISQDLFELLLGEIKLEYKKIIVSPGESFYPFEALIIAENSNQPEYLVNKYVVSYTYSANYLLRENNHISASDGKDFLGLAPLDYPASFSLSKLHGSDVSLKSISSFISGDIFSGVSASRKTFLNNFYRYNIVQLYTHASDSSGKGEPVIYFSDSTIYLTDIISESRPATKLIVLSACETGLGSMYRGEGIFSFNRGFALAGIPSSVTNLWTIDNESTYKITELFYKYIADGLPLDEALQKAKIDFIETSSKEKQLPYYWAAAVLVGNTDAIAIQKNRNWPLYIITIGVPALIFILFLAIRKRKRIIPIQDIMETVS